MRIEGFMNKSHIGISRRTFIGGAATAGAVASLGLLAGCGDDRITGSNAAETVKWDYETDTLVVGSGGGAWGALAAHEAGDSVILIEKNMLWGGTSGMSGGAFWVPNNDVEKAQGINDTDNDLILKYVEGTALGYSSDEIRRSYLENSIKWVQWAQELGFVFEFNQGGTGFQDYYGLPGTAATGRSLVVSPAPSYKVLLDVDLSADDFASKGYSGHAWYLVRELLERGGVDIMMETTAKRLVQDSDGAVIGVIAESRGSDIGIKAKKVILAAGGFDHNASMINNYLRIPLAASFCVATNTGDGHRMGMEIGADLDNMSSYYGMPFELPDGPTPGKQVMTADIMDTRTKPGVIAVNRKGRRFANEKSSYHVFCRGFETWDSGTFELVNIPGYLIGDSSYMDRYTFPATSAPGEIPPYVKTFDSLESLAVGMGIDRDTLLEEVALFNGYTATGVDPDWHVGESQFEDNMLAMYAIEVDTSLPNPLLAPISTPPFFCLPIYPGTLGTAGGLKTNGNAQVLDVNGEIIPNLYAAGCNAAGPFGAGYPGAGGPVGASSVMSWVAGSHTA